MNGMTKVEKIMYDYIWSLKRFKLMSPAAAPRSVTLADAIKYRY